MKNLLSRMCQRRDGVVYACSRGRVCLLVGAFFALDLHSAQSGNIVISEIMYNPVPGPDLVLGGTNTVDGDEFEFLELYNSGESSCDLNGWTVSNAVEFSFSKTTILAPGEYLVLVENETHFIGRYPRAVSAVAGQWGGKLSDGGEQVTLRDQTNGIVFSVKYNDSASWPQRADGKGASLVLSDVGGDPDNPASWCDSDMFLGTPGEAGICAQTDILINEILAHTDPPLEDAIEVFNYSAGSIDLDGWYLSDSPLQPRKYRVTNTTVSAGGHHVFYEYQFNTNAPVFDNRNIPFALSELGDELYLTAPNPETNQLRLVDVVEFGVTANGVSIGRYPDGKGGFSVLSEHSFGVSSPASLAEFRSGTGAPNAVPANPTVIINEIMYHPVQTPEQAYEYIELYNTTASSIDVSGWTYGGIQFTNPPGTVIAAGSCLVVAADSTALMAHHGITGVVGNWVGQLSNDGERIRLFDEEGVLVDEVGYRDGSPWATGADGVGPSLERVQWLGPSDTPVNWRASRADTNWVQIVWTQTVSSGMYDLKLWLDFEGKCWIDDVSVAKAGESERISNGDFESGLTPWGWTESTNNHSQSRVESGIGRGGSDALVLAGNLSRYIRVFDLNPVSLEFGNAETNHVVSGSFMASGTYVVSFWVKRQSPGGNLVSAFGGKTVQHPLSHEGTPGVSNSVQSLLPPIGITSVDQDFSIVEVSSNNVIRAVVESESGVSSVTIHYRPVGSNTYQYTDAHYTSLPMLDNGVAPDLISGDSVYVAILPSAANRHIVRYHVTAVASNGMQTRSPQVDDQSDDFGFWVESHSIETNLPNWHVFFDGPEIRYPIAVRACAVSDEGQVFTDIRIRHRGRVASNPASSTFVRGGVALRFQDDRRYDAWFKNNRDGINFRQRENDSYFYYRRVVNEWLAYELQRELGLVTPHYRHVCVWLNGAPTITGELEAPDTGFLDLHRLSQADYVSRAGWTGRARVDGNEALDNFDSTFNQLSNLSNEERINTIRTNVWYESVRYSVAYENLVGNGDQYFKWNMIQHRLATNGLWTQYPWDLDMAFNVETNKIPGVSTGAFLPELHPYYESVEHPSIWNDSEARPMGKSLFSPETDPSTLPYRHRQQMTLWRWYHTLFTTNYLFPKLDKLEMKLTPAYQAIQPYTGVNESFFREKIREVKKFIELRRSFLHDGSWSDQNTNIWNRANVYDESSVVINEIMPQPIMGGEYLELYNTSTQTVDVSHWLLESANETYRFPLGTQLGPTSYLVVADRQWDLTNTFSSIRQNGQLVHRYKGIPIWDFPLNFSNATEYASRIIEIPQITLPGTGGVLRLSSITGEIIDEVTYSSMSPWPAREGYSLELLDPLLDNSVAESWRMSFVLGTPGFANSATNDMDGDQLLDTFEQLVINEYGGTLASVGPADDQDGDGYSLEKEFVLGLNPVLGDGAGLDIEIRDAGFPLMAVEFPTIPVSGPTYDLFSSRRYTLEVSTNLIEGGGWTVLPTYLDVIGLGQTVIYTNRSPAGNQYYRYQVELSPNY